jgi:hypothetical protein
MSVENALEDLSDEESNSSHGISKLISENIRIDVKPQAVKHESLLPEEEFKRKGMIKYSLQNSDIV